MPDQLEITDPDGERRLVAVGPNGCVVGSAVDVEVRLSGAEIEARHLRFVPTGVGVRVEPVRPGSTVEINGEALFCKDLVSGDVVELDGHRLRWLADLATPVRRPAGMKSRRHAAGAARAGTRTPRAAANAPGRLRARPRSMPTSISVLLTIVGVLLIALIVLRLFRDSTWPSSPQHYVDLARAQLANQEAQRALDTLAFALREATGATKAEALQLETEIRRMLVELAEAPKVLAARQEHDVLLGFVDRYLQPEATRAAAREFVRSCDQWLQQHRALCAQNRDGQPLVRTIESQRERFVGLAALDQPDTPDDVLMAARARLRFQWRDYRGAVARLDAFLLQNPDAEAVRAERERCLTEGEEWLRGKLRLLDVSIGRGDLGNAERDLAQIERWSMLPEWAPLVQEVRQRVAAAR